MSRQLVALGTIKSRYYRIARQLGAPKRQVMFATQPEYGGGSYVERVGDAYAYVVSERGTEFERRITRDPDELLYWLVAELTFEMALEHELAHRREGVDSRRLLFEKHLELLGLAKPEWSATKRREYDDVLRVHPFQDGRA